MNKSNKNYIVLSFLFLMIAGVLYYFLYQKIKGNNEATAQAELSWHLETIRQNDLRSLDRSIKVISEEKEVFNSHFANTEDIVPFLDTLEKLAKSVGSEAEVFSVEQVAYEANQVSKKEEGEDSKSDTSQSAQPDIEKKSLSVGMKVFGSFSSIYKFITLLENSPYELKIMSLSLEKDVSGASLDKLSLPKWRAILKVRLISFIPE
jgi:hypothetical protein